MDKMLQKQDKLDEQDIDLHCPLLKYVLRSVHSLSQIEHSDNNIHYSSNEIGPEVPQSSL